MLKHEIIKKENHTLTTLNGRIDGVTAGQLEKHFSQLILDGERNIVANLKQINYISSIGLRVFLKTQKKLKKIAGQLILHQASEMVLEVLQMAGFDKVLKVVNEENYLFLFDEQKNEKLEQVTFKDLKVLSQKKESSFGKISIIGDSTKLVNANYTEADVIKVEAETIDFGLGLAALGSKYHNYKNYFGECLVLKNNLLVYPAAQQTAVDIMFAGKESYKFLNGFKVKGSFNSVSLLEQPNGFIDIEDIVEFTKQNSKSNYSAFVLMAESKGIMGMNLKKVPVEDNVDNIFARDKIMNWVNFSIEPEDFNNLVLAVGVVAKQNTNKQLFGTDVDFHVHAAVIEDEAINKSFDSFENEIKRLLMEAEVLKIQHLMKNSKFQSAMLGIIELEDI